MIPDAFPGDRTRRPRAPEAELRRRGPRRLALLVGALALFPLGLVAGMALMGGPRTVAPSPSSVARVSIATAR